jgi:hypothetical protein
MWAFSGTKIKKKNELNSSCVGTPSVPVQDERMHNEIKKKSI